MLGSAKYPYPEASDDGSRGGGDVMDSPDLHLWLMKPYSGSLEPGKWGIVSIRSSSKGNKNFQV